MRPLWTAVPNRLSCSLRLMLCPIIAVYLCFVKRHCGKKIGKSLLFLDKTEEHRLQIDK